MKLNEREAQAVVNLSANKDFQIYMEYISRLAEYHNEKLIFADPSTIELQQGMTRAFVTIVKQLCNAEVQLQKYRGKDQ